MKTRLLAFATLCAAQAASAQVDFFLVGSPTSVSGYTVTDISEDGRVAVGVDGAGGVWRWQRGVGVQAMPPINVPGGTGPCTIHNAFVSADGMRVVGDAGGPQCNGRVYQVYQWNVGSPPTIGPANSGPYYYRVRGCSATGSVGGSVEDTGYYSMFSQAFFTFPDGAYDVNEPGCVPGDWIYSLGFGITPDGLVLGSVTDCDALHGGGIWRGGTSVTRLTQVPIAGSWGAAVVISQTSQWTPTSGWVAAVPPGSVATDISWDGSVVAANLAVGPTNAAAYVHSGGTPAVLRTELLATGVTQVQNLQLVSASAVSGDGRWMTGIAQLPTGQKQAYVARIPRICGDIDFNNDGMFPDVLDIEALITTMQGSVCSPPCDSIDFNADGQYPDTVDIDAFLRVFSGGPCL